LFLGRLYAGKNLYCSFIYLIFYKTFLFDEK
jgi:hypothetical protein